MTDIKTQNKVYEAKITKRLEKMIQYMGLDEQSARNVLEANQAVKKSKKVKKEHISGYNLYAREVMDDVRKEYPKNKQEENLKIIGVMWKQLSETEQEQYNQRATQIKPKNKADSKRLTVIDKDLKRLFK